MFSRPALQDAPVATRCEVFAATALRVRSGVNAGDDLGSPETPCAGDIYRLEPTARPVQVRLTAPGPDGLRRIGLGSEIAGAGSTLAVEARLLLMATDGVLAEVLVLQPCLPDETAPGRLLLPLQPLIAGIDHTLIRIDVPPGPCRLPDLTCGMLGRGTRLLLATGTLCPVEALRPGDCILTRDHGAQPVRWIGRITQRAAGVFAPVVIGRGAMGNAGDLTVGAHQRVYIRQPDPRPGHTTPQVPMQARELVDGGAIRQHEGGFVDYLCLVLDAHEIVLAEGIPTESLQVTEATLCRLPDVLACDLRAQFPTLSHRPRFGTDARCPCMDVSADTALFGQT